MGHAEVLPPAQRGGDDPPGDASGSVSLLPVGSMRCLSSRQRGGNETDRALQPVAAWEGKRRLLLDQP